MVNYIDMKLVKARTRIWSRKARLKALFLYTTKKINNG